MDAIQQMFADNMRRMGLDVAASDPVAPAQPARRTVQVPDSVEDLQGPWAGERPVRVVAAKPTPTSTYDAPVKPESIVEHVQQIERFDSNIQERVWKLEKQGVRDPRISELEARVKILEQMLKPALAEKPVSEIDKIATEHAMLVERGKTELTYHEYRLMKRTARQALLAEAASV